MNIPAPEFAELLEEGLAHHRSGRLTEAVAHYARILDAVPDHPDALHLLGLAAHHFGQDEQALTLLTRAIACRPDIAGYHNSRGVALVALQRREEAVQAFHHALHLDPHCQDAQRNLMGMGVN